MKRVTLGRETLPNGSLNIWIPECLPQADRERAARLTKLVLGKPSGTVSGFDARTVQIQLAELAYQLKLKLVWQDHLPALNYEPKPGLHRGQKSKRQHLGYGRPTWTHLVP